MPKIHPRYEDFAWENPAVDDAAILRAAKNTEVVYAPTGASTDTAEQRLAVYRTVPDEIKDAKVIWRFAAWSDDYGRSPEGALFNAAIAQDLGRVVLAINNPGVHFSKWHKDGVTAEQTLVMTPDQRESVSSGNFRPIGGATVRAAIFASKHFGLSVESPYIYGSSLAGAIAGAGARYALDNGVTPGGIALEDVANYDQVPLLELGNNFRKEGGYMKGYLAQNPEVIRDADENPLRWIRRSFLERQGFTSNLALARGLARGSFIAMLGDPDAFQDMPVLITGGSASLINKGIGQEKAVKHLRNGGADVEEVIYGGHHHNYTVTSRAPTDALRQVA